MAAVPQTTFGGEVVAGARAQDDLETGQISYAPLPNHPGYEGLMIRIGALGADPDARRILRTWTLEAENLYEADNLTGYGERGYYEVFDEDQQVEVAAGEDDRFEWKVMPCVRPVRAARANAGGRSLFDLNTATPNEIQGIREIMRTELDGGGLRGEEIPLADARLIFRAAHLSTSILTNERLSSRKEPIALATQRALRQKTQELDDRYYTRSTATLSVEAVTDLLTWEVIDYAHFARRIQPSTKETGLRLIREGLEIAGAIWRRLLGDAPNFVSDYYAEMAAKMTHLKSYVSDNIESVSVTTVTKLIQHDMLTLKLALSTLAAEPRFTKVATLTVIAEGWNGNDDTEASRRNDLWTKHHDTREQASQMQSDQEAMVTRLVTEQTQNLKRQLAGIDKGGAQRRRVAEVPPGMPPAQGEKDREQKLAAWTKGPKLAAKPDPPELVGNYIVTDRKCKKGRCKLDKVFLLHGRIGDAKHAQVIFTNQLARRVFPGSAYAKYYAVRKWQLERNPDLVTDHVSYIEKE